MAVAGYEDDIQEVTKLLGKHSPSKLREESQDYGIQRIFVSNPKVAGQSIASLNLNEQFSTIITRIRRGDSDLLARGGNRFGVGRSRSFYFP